MYSWLLVKLGLGRIANDNSLIMRDATNLEDLLKATQYNTASLSEICPVLKHGLRSLAYMQVGVILVIMQA